MVAASEMVPFCQDFPFWFRIVVSSLQDSWCQWRCWTPELDGAEASCLVHLMMAVIFGQNDQNTHPTFHPCPLLKRRWRRDEGASFGWSLPPFLPLVQSKPHRRLCSVFQNVFQFFVWCSKELWKECPDTPGENCPENVSFWKYDLLIVTVVTI